MQGLEGLKPHRPQRISQVMGTYVQEGHYLNRFEALGLSKHIGSNLNARGLVDPTPIQLEAIPIVLEGRDVLGLAQTGTGKTAAFGLPIIHNLIKLGTKPPSKTVRALILAPTRELAKQICDSLIGFQGGGHLKINMVVGGLSINAQKQRLDKGSDIVVATPGRLIDLLTQGALTLSDAKYLVLDEADQMLDMGFIQALRQIAKLLPTPRQTLLFSATMPKLMEELAATYLSHPRKIQVANLGKAVDKVLQKICFIAKSEKTALLIEHLSKHTGELSLVFVRTKSGAERLLKQLDRAGFGVGSIHGNKSQNQRDKALSLFKSGRIKILVATDVASRGIDIPDVGYVYNFDLPNVAEIYIHRIGRTARAGKGGTAVTFCAADEMDTLKSIEKLMKDSIPIESGVRWIVTPEKNKKGKKTINSEYPKINTFKRFGSNKFGKPFGKKTSGSPSGSQSRGKSKKSI